MILKNLSSSQVILKYLFPRWFENISSPHRWLVYFSRQVNLVWVNIFEKQIAYLVSIIALLSIHVEITWLLYIDFHDYLYWNKAENLKFQIRLWHSFRMSQERKLKAYGSWPKAYLEAVGLPFWVFWQFQQN